MQDEGTTGSDADLDALYAARRREIRQLEAEQGRLLGEQQGLVNGLRMKVADARRKRQAEAVDALSGKLHQAIQGLGHMFARVGESRKPETRQCVDHTTVVQALRAIVTDQAAAVEALRATLAELSPGPTLTTLNPPKGIPKS